MSCTPCEPRANRKEKVNNFESALSQLKHAVAENSRMLDALLEHFDLPYKPPAGFIKE